MVKRDKDADLFIIHAIRDQDEGPNSDFALSACARKIYASRRERDKRSPLPGLFGEPAWDILLDLFISYAEHKKISIMSAGLAAHASTTTALRWVWALEDAHLVERKLDRSDKRRSYVSLAPEGLNYMRETLAKIRDQL
ncbi:winged helix DNA-binding protein [Novosphingobium sp.]|uniref:winged helix DNA-binding protein n=1 Tax=Novosphingobium sp. TaxID=1874826 RepID=UPI003D0D2037